MPMKDPSYIQRGVINVISSPSLRPHGVSMQTTPRFIELVPCVIFIALTRGIIQLWMKVLMKVHLQCAENAYKGSINLRSLTVNDG